MVEIVTALLASVFGNKLLMGLLASVVGGVGLFVAGGIRRAKKDRAAQAVRDLAAAQDRLEMNREATAIERQTVGQTDEQARQEAAPWVRP